jgi:hypothetical protein
VLPFCFGFGAVNIEKYGMRDGLPMRAPLIRENLSKSEAHGRSAFI